MTILSRFRETTLQNLVPLQATLELTYRCNERCGHCYLATYDDRADGRPPLRLEEWQRALDQLAEAGVLMLILMGGEAMLHRDFWAIAEHAAQRNFALNLITNGLLIDDAAARRLAALRFYSVTISLYSLDPVTHDRMTRHKGSHTRTLNAIEHLRAHGVTVGINCLLTRENIDRCFELQDWAAAQGIQLKFDPMITPKSDADLGPTAERASPEQLRAYYRALKARGQGPQPVSPGELDDPVCTAGRGKCAINVYGDLLTCLEVRDPIGNLRESSFAELWASPKAERLRAHKVRDLKFEATCGDGEFCDHCPGMARAETGDPMKAVPFLMELARIKREVYESPGPSQGAPDVGTR